MHSVVLITPFGMTNQSAVLADLGNMDVVYSKPVLLHPKLLEKHFSFLDEDKQKAVITEWNDQTIWAVLVNNIDPAFAKKWVNETYVSPSEALAQKEVQLWFPELATN